MRRVSTILIFALVAAIVGCTIAPTGPTNFDAIPPPPPASGDGHATP